MCEPASFMVTKNNILFNPPEFGESHSVIMGRNHIKNDEHEIRGVAVEIIPPKFDFTLPFNEWIFEVDFPKDLLPEWWNAKEAEIACRAKLPEWFKAHCVKEDTVIESGFYLIMEGSPNITVNGGHCEIHGNSSPNITINKGGRCRTFGKSSLSTIIVNKGGHCYTLGNSSSIVIVNKGGCCRIYGNSSPNIIVNENGLCYTFSHSSPNIIVNKGGYCYTHDASIPTIIVNESGYCKTFDRSNPTIIDNQKIRMV